jgi:hypothetical protein
VVTRTRIDGLLLEGIRNGNSAINLSKKLEQFLLPSRAAFRTGKPYGVDASADAMRLARSEITRAHSFASYVAGLGNPFVDGWDFALSVRHPRFDICDRLATIGMQGERLRDPYNIYEAGLPIPVQDTHPHCLCSGRPAVTRSADDVIADLRESIGRGEEPPITPIDAYQFVRLMLGGYLASQVAREELEDPEFA